MTKAQVVDMLMSAFNAEEKWRKFFTEELDRLHGEGNIVTDDLYKQYLKHFNNLT